MQLDLVSMPQPTLSPRKLKIQQSEFAAIKKTLYFMLQELMHSTPTFNDGLPGFFRDVRNKLNPVLFSRVSTS